MITDQTDNRERSSRKGPRGGVTIPFPEKLHFVLNHVEYADIISWQPHGRCFILHKPQEFLKYIMPNHFRQSKLTSFQRQLNLYGFCRITAGPDKGSYFHELFLRGNPSLCADMIRVRVKGTGNRSSSCSQEAPNFYAMPPIDADEEVVACASDKNKIEASMKWHKHSNPNLGYKSTRADSSLRGKSSVISVTSSSSFGSSNSDAPVSTYHAQSPCPPVSSVSKQRKPITKNITHSPKLLGVSISVPVSPPVQSQVYDSDMESFDLGQSVHIPVQDELVMFEGKSFHYIESRCIKEKTEITHEGRRRSITIDEESNASTSKRIILKGVVGTSYTGTEFDESMVDLSITRNDFSSE